MRDVAIAQFTSRATKEDAYVGFGFVPDYVEIVVDVAGNPPEAIYYWYNPASFDNFPAAPKALKLTCSTGVVTEVATAVTVHEGGTVLDDTAEDDDHLNHFDRSGTAKALNAISVKGIQIHSEIQTNSKKVLVRAYRNDV